MNNSSVNDTSSKEATPTIYPRNKHTVSRGLIDPDALKIMYRLIRHGYKAYLVGGGVRDLLLEKQPKDFDIGTDATPRKIKALFRNCRIIGRRFKLAHIYFKNNKIIEVATFRDIQDPIGDENEESDGNGTLLPDNRYGTAATDAFRRDLTINGLFYDLSTFSVIDYVGGMKDLQAEIIRVIGDPETRFTEDPVRMLRVIRHAARAGFRVEPACWEAIEKNHDLILQASPVRIYEEVKKDLSSGASLPILRLLSQSALMQHLLPEFLVVKTNLLSDGSFFASVLERIDSEVQTGTKLTVTPILSLFALFFASYPDSAEAFHTYFEDKQDLSDHIQSCFIKLAVPRKERERMEDVLSLWLKLMSTPVERLKKLNLERRRCLEEVWLILSWLSDNPESDQRLAVIAEAKEKRKKVRRGRRRGRREGERPNTKSDRRPKML